MIIYKFPLMITDRQEILLPRNSKVLSVQEQYGDMTIWVLVDPSDIKVRKAINIVGTGNPILNDPGEFIGTVQTNGGSLVWHVFDGGIV